MFPLYINLYKIWKNDALSPPSYPFFYSRELHHRRRSWNCFLPGCRSDQKSGGSEYQVMDTQSSLAKACLKMGRMLTSLACLHVMLVNTLCSLLQDILCPNTQPTFG
ncbi:hypothetical protein LOK49_LG07G03198 [Camellia lanceoleosa]|uniref:Uncharacterized protein n=1 Tax=Camellia lanceoleosa TaxID=1840588 RepID=A0ACC0H6N2_9ERIC|nr:hypothetical protein LOK49_LG07G03198 [Camellia lanceoleosa]